MTQETGSSSLQSALNSFADSAIRSFLIVVETAYPLEALDPGFAAALHDSMGLNLTVPAKRSRQVLGMRD
jgi:hypothetical protein